MKRPALIWLILAAFAVLACYEAGKLPFGSVSAPAAGFFPRVLAGILVVLAVAGLIAATRTKGDSEPSALRLAVGKILMAVMALLAFAAMFEFAGYILTTFVFVSFLLRVVERQSWTQAGAVALSASILSYVVFGLLLGAPLPAGFLRV